MEVQENFNDQEETNEYKTKRVNKNSKSKSRGLKKHLPRNFWRKILRPKLEQHSAIKKSEVFKTLLQIINNEFSIVKFKSLEKFFGREKGINSFLRLKLFCLELHKTLLTIKEPEFKGVIEEMDNFCDTIINTGHCECSVIAENENWYFVQIKKESPSSSLNHTTSTAITQSFLAALNSRESVMKVEEDLEVKKEEAY
jgi:hypothetical protein